MQFCSYLWYMCACMYHVPGQLHDTCIYVYYGPLWECLWFVGGHCKMCVYVHGRLWVCECVYVCLCMCMCVHV